MTSEYKIVEEPKKPLSMHPKKFAMWLFLPAWGCCLRPLPPRTLYGRRRATGSILNCQNFFTTILSFILLSTVTMQWAYWSAKKDNLDRVKLLVSLTSILGIAFLLGQVLAWRELVKMSVYLVGNPSGSFLYVLTGLHGLHLVTAIIFLFIVLNSTWKYRVHSKNMAQMEMCTTYWHFLSGLWLYLFVFLVLYR